MTHPEEPASVADTDTPGIFRRIEDTLVRRLREHDWAAGVLARYQYFRFARSLERDIAGIMTASRVLEMLEQHGDRDEQHVSRLLDVYRARCERRRGRLRHMATEFPEFYTRFETRLFAKVALMSARNTAAASLQHGEIGAKAHARIERRIRAALAALPPITDPAPKLEPSDLIGMVPLLNGLSPRVMERLAEQARAVTFLAGDVVIGEGERGDALYLITHGRVSVRRHGQVIAELRDGDFFGEMALLGDQVRTATVRAETPSTLLRLRRRDVLALVDTDPELRRRLEQAQGTRRNGNTG